MKPIIGAAMLALVIASAQTQAHTNPAPAGPWQSAVVWQATPSIVQGLLELAPSLDASVATRALQAAECALSDGQRVDRLLVVDMGLPSTAKRLWAFDLTDLKPRLVLHDHVSHGAGSDPNATGKAQRFSNTPNSNMTSLGLYRVAEAYTGKHGGSRRLDGLTPGFNDKARARAVVMHPASYVGNGRAGRSHGCPAVSPQAMAALEQVGLTGALLWIDGPDAQLAQLVAQCGTAGTSVARVDLKKGR